MIQRGSLASLLVCAAVAGAPAIAPGAEEGGEETPGEEAAPSEDGGPFSSFWNDPTLNGKLHLTYRALYRAKVYQFHEYRYPFPGAVNDLDREQARLLEKRHEDISDQDVDQYFALRLEQIPVLDGSSGWIQSAGGDASFRFFKDIDGSPAGEEAKDGFDHFAHRDAFQLATLNARFETLSRHLEIVAGRQFGREAEWLHFDGGTATFRGLEVLGRQVEMSGFAGARVTYYPQSASSLDGLYGGHVKSWLTDGTTLKVTDVYYVDNSLEAELRQDFGGAGWLALTYRNVNEFPHSVLLEGAFEALEKTLSIYFLYVGKLGRSVDDFNFEYTQSARRRRDDDKDMYFNIGDIVPYDEVTLEVRKELAGKLGVFAGGTIHRLRARDLEDNYNTDWQEVWVGLDASDLLWRGLTGRGTVRYVHTDLPRRLLRLDPDEVAQNGTPDFRAEDVTGDGEPSALSVELFAEQDFARKVAVGSTVVLRAYDYQSNFTELDNITAASVGAHVRWKATPLTQWVLSYSYDRDYEFVNPDFEALHTVRLQFILRW